MEKERERKERGGERLGKKRGSELKGNGKGGEDAYVTGVATAVSRGSGKRPGGCLLLETGCSAVPQ